MTIDKYLSFMNEIFMSDIFPIILIIGMILWFYCLWFYHKYDKDTTRLILLLILNIYYTPFYLYRIKNIKRQNEIKRIGENVYDYEFIKNSRECIISVLELWSNKNNASENYSLEANCNLTEELFIQWENSYEIDKKILNEAFNETEIELLNSFDKTISDSKSKYRDSYPEFKEFKKTNDFIVIQRLANEIMKELN